MGYVAVKAGEEIIERAEALFEKQRLAGESTPVSVEQVDEQFGRLTDQAAGEAGLYAPRLAALAVKQAQGDTVEAAFLLRAYRSTLERFGPTTTADPDAIRVVRRVSPAYKDVPGGQILGPTKDYTQRLLDVELAEEGDGDGTDPGDPTADWDVDPEAPPESVPSVASLLREQGLLDGDDDGADADDPEPADTTREPVTHPADRDEVLQELARGETGAVTALGYTALRGYGQVHPTVAEVRVGALPVEIEHPYTGDPVTVAECTVTQCESIVPVYAKRDDPQFAFGYGLTFGRNERKAIAASILDASIQLDGESEPAENPEFVLDAIDGMDSFGFIEHLKLPHYVTFQSILDRIRSIRKRQAAGAGAEADDDGRGGGDAAGSHGDEADADGDVDDEADADGDVDDEADAATTEVDDD